MSFSAINMDFSQTKRIAFNDSAWEASPSPGVARIKLERQAAESGHTTSIVRYEPGKSFPRHDHPTGEEFLVLKGVFSDEHGDYPQGAYVRNPPGSAHQPFSREGCVLLVKLCQMKDEKDRVVLNLKAHSNQLCFHHPTLAEKVSFEYFQAGQNWRFQVEGGLEILVVEGEIKQDDRMFQKWSWLRFPDGASLEFVFERSTLLWIKRGHHSFLPLE